MSSKNSETFLLGKKTSTSNNPEKLKTLSFFLSLEPFQDLSSVTLMMPANGSLYYSSVKWACATYSSSSTDPEKLWSSQSFTQLSANPHLVRMLPPRLLLVLLLTIAVSSSTALEKTVGSTETNRTQRQIHFNFPILNRLFGHGHSDDHDDADRWAPDESVFWKSQ